MRRWNETHVENATALLRQIGLIGLVILIIAISVLCLLPTPAGT